MIIAGHISLFEFGHLILINYQENLLNKDAGVLY